MSELKAEQLIWVLTCMNKEELAKIDFNPWLRDQDRQIMNLRGIVASQIDNFVGLEGQVTFKIQPVKENCWHFLRLVQCMEVLAVYITDLNDTQVTAHFYSAIVCPECLNHSEVKKTGATVAKYPISSR